MAVGNVEIAVGQVWRCRDGSEHSVARDCLSLTPRWVLDDGNIVSETGRYHSGLVNHPLDLIELVRDEHGFTPWAGGACPVAEDALVQYRLNESPCVYHPLPAKKLAWGKEGFDDITAYKVIDSSAETLTNDIMVSSVLQDGIREAMEIPDSASLAEETLSALGWVFDGTTWVEKPKPKVSLPEWDGVARIEMYEPAVSAPALLTAAAKHMNDRAATYDKPEGERSMAQTVAIFKAFHGIDLTEAQGWHFMQVLKDVRLFTREAYHADSAEDCIAYAALKAEAMAQEGGV